MNTKQLTVYAAQCDQCHTVGPSAATNRAAIQAAIDANWIYAVEGAREATLCHRCRHDWGGEWLIVFGTDSERSF